MNDAPALNEMERDAVTELANIGVSRAAASLRKMVGQQVLLSVPSVDILTRKAAATLVSEREDGSLVAVQQVFTGRFSGRALLIFPQSNSLELIRAVIGDKELSTFDAEEMEEEALAETGNVILNGCLGTIANMLRESLHLSLPQVTRGNSSDLFESNEAESENGLVLFLYINFSVRDRDIRGYIAMLMDLPALASMRLLIAEFVKRHMSSDVAAENSPSLVDDQRQGTTPTAKQSGERRVESREAAIERLRATVTLSDAAAGWEWQIREDRIIGDARFARLYGLKLEDVIAGVDAETFFTIVHPDDQTRIRLAVYGALHGADVFSKEFRIVLANGSTRWMHGRGYSRNDIKGRPSVFAGVLIDITDQKRVEEQLRISQTAGGIGTFEHIDGFATVSVSPYFCQLLGLQPAKELPVRTINRIVHAADPPLIETKNFELSGSTDVEFRITRPDTGEVRWLTRRGEYIRDASSADLRFSGVIYDITSSKLTEARLRELNETLEARVKEQTRERDGIWRLSEDLLGIADRNGVWISINPAWHLILGWQDSDIIGRTLEWIEHPEERNLFRSQIDALGQSVSSMSFRGRLLERSGEVRSLAWTVTRQDDRLYCVGRDVTEQLQRDESLARAEEQLRQSQKMEAIGQLTGGIAHDFNNMLTGVIASLNLIQRRLRDGRTDDVDRFIEAATSSAHRAANLTHSLLAFSRRQSLDITSRNVNALLEGLEPMLRRALGESISFNRVLFGDLWHASTDANQLESAFLNLVINARDAMPNGGVLTIETRNVSFDQAYCAVHADATPGEFVCIVVRDTGAGMSPETVARAFDPFFTTKPIGQGTGLGLSMIYGFVKQSGGHVRLSSRVGEGTTVCLYLPRAEEEELVPDAQLKFVPQGHGETVLVVEDDETVRLLVTQVLEELGYHYIQAVDARRALPYLEANRRIDLMITDVGLPHINGRQLADIARKLRPDLRILFITGYAEQAALRSRFLAPGMEMMTKPFDLGALGEKIRDLLKG
jgi:PAS domain S-box-containing protein